MVKLRVQHISLDVDDLDAALRFYCDALGLTVAARPAALGDGGAWLDIGDGRQLHLVESASFSPPATSQHLAFGVDDCQATVIELRDAGLEVSDPFDIGAGIQAFLRDPAGNLLEFNEPTT